jgi:hypothetical protein
VLTLLVLFNMLPLSNRPARVEAGWRGCLQSYRERAGVHLRHGKVSYPLHGFEIYQESEETLSAVIQGLSIYTQELVRDTFC